MFDPLNSSNGFDYQFIVFDDTDGSEPYYCCPNCRRKLTHNQVRDHKCVDPYKLLQRILDKIAELNKTVISPTHVGFSKLIVVEANRKLLEELLKE